MKTGKEAKKGNKRLKTIKKRLRNEEKTIKRRHDVKRNKSN